MNTNVDAILLSIIKFPIGLEIALFSCLEHFKIIMWYKYTIKKMGVFLSQF